MTERRAERVRRMRPALLATTMLARSRSPREVAGIEDEIPVKTASARS